MTYEIGTIKGEGVQGNMQRTGNENFLLKIRQLLTGRAWIEDTSYSGTGDGVIQLADSAVGAPSETWTLTVTDDTTPGSEIWSVTGSVSGAQANATTGVPYDNSIIKFTISAGVTNFVNTDSWTLTATASPIPTADRWTVLFELGLDFTYTSSPQFALSGPDISGFDPVYIAFYVFRSVASDYYNLAGQVGTGWLTSPPPTNISDMPQYTRKTICMWQFNIPYWITFNDRRVAFGVAIENIMEAGYFGLYLPYFNPGEYPYPAVAMGSLDGNPATRYSDLARYIGCMNTGGFVGSTRLRHWSPSGAWVNTETWPWMQSDTSPQAYNFNPTENAALIPVQDLSAVDRRALLPVLLMSSTDLYGEFEGVFYISGFSLIKQDIVQENGIDYVVVGNIYRTGFHDYLAIRMD